MQNERTVPARGVRQRLFIEQARTTSRSLFTRTKVRYVDSTQSRFIFSTSPPTHSQPADHIPPGRRPASMREDAKRPRITTPSTERQATATATFRTISRTSRCHLLDSLPEELFHIIARHLLRFPRCFLHVASLRATCKDAQSRSELLWREFMRMAFEPTLCTAVMLLSRFRVAHAAAGFNNAWACCGLLPTTGRSCWAIRLDVTMREGAYYVGVSNAAGTTAWGLALAQGHMRRWSRDAVTGRVRGAPTPAGFPQGHRTHVLYDEQGAAYHLKGACNPGLVVECVLDADVGSLSFRIVGAPVPSHQRWPPSVEARSKLLLGVAGFPKGVPLRPWVRTMDSPETLSIRPALDVP